MDISHEPLNQLNFKLDKIKDLLFNFQISKFPYDFQLNYIINFVKENK